LLLTYNLPLTFSIRNRSFFDPNQAVSSPGLVKS
jgi:hypothetical protein